VDWRRRNWQLYLLPHNDWLLICCLCNISATFLQHLWNMCITLTVDYHNWQYYMLPHNDDLISATCQQHFCNILWAFPLLSTITPGSTTCYNIMTRDLSSLQHFRNISAISQQYRSIVNVILTPLSQWAVSYFYYLSPNFISSCYRCIFHHISSNSISGCFRFVLQHAVQHCRSKS